jgi:signal transduction histidine kinase
MIVINELLDHALEFTRVKGKEQTESKGIKIHIQKVFSPLPPMLGSASELREVFTNIINNAVDAMPQGGELSIKTVNGSKQNSLKGRVLIWYLLIWAFPGCPVGKSRKRLKV